MDDAIEEINYLIQGIERGIQMNLEDIDHCLMNITRERKRMTEFQGLYEEGLKRLASLKRAVQILEAPHD